MKLSIITLLVTTVFFSAAAASNLLGSSSSSSSHVPALDEIKRTIADSFAYRGSISEFKNVSDEQGVCVEFLSLHGEPTGTVMRYEFVLKKIGSNTGVSMRACVEFLPDGPSSWEYVPI